MSNVKKCYQEITQLVSGEKEDFVKIQMQITEQLQGLSVGGTGRAR